MQWKFEEKDGWRREENISVALKWLAAVNLRNVYCKLLTQNLVQFCIIVIFQGDF